MMTKRNEYIPQTVTHPGITLKEKLDEIGMSQKEFAVRTGKPEQTIVKVIDGKSALTPDMAVKFESVLGIPAPFWLNRQQNYDEAVARLKRSELLAKANDWVSRFPLKKMTDFGWLPEQRSKEEKAEALLSFFSISSSKAWEDFYLSEKLKVSFRISLAHYGEPYAMSAWLRQGELQAMQLDAPPFDRKAFLAALDGIKKVMAEHPDDYFSQLQRLCLDAGVKVVHTPCLPKAPMHGSTRWLGDNMPLIQLSARYKQNDRFWFTFFMRPVIFCFTAKNTSRSNVRNRNRQKTKKREADAFAVRWTFSEEEEQEVLRYGKLTEQDIIDFARKFETHPAMIIGRFQHKKRLPYSVGRQFMKLILLDKQGF